MTRVCVPDFDANYAEQVFGVKMLSGQETAAGSLVFFIRVLSEYDRALPPKIVEKLRRRPFFFASVSGYGEENVIAWKKYARPETQLPLGLLNIAAAYKFYDAARESMDAAFKLDKSGRAVEHDIDQLRAVRDYMHMCIAYLDEARRVLEPIQRTVRELIWVVTLPDLVAMRHLAIVTIHICTHFLEPETGQPPHHLLNAADVMREIRPTVSIRVDVDEVKHKIVQLIGCWASETFRLHSDQPLPHPFEDVTPESVLVYGAWYGPGRSPSAEAAEAAAPFVAALEMFLGFQPDPADILRQHTKALDRMRINHMGSCIFTSV